MAADKISRRDVLARMRDVMLLGAAPALAPLAALAQAQAYPARTVRLISPTARSISWISPCRLGRPVWANATTGARVWLTSVASWLASRRRSARLACRSAMVRTTGASGPTVRPFTASSVCPARSRIRAAR